MTKKDIRSYIVKDINKLGKEIVTLKKKQKRIPQNSATVLSSYLITRKATLKEILSLI
jgi:hypothetical protein